MALITAQQRRGATRDISILQADGNVLVPSSGDTIRAVIGRIHELGDDLSGSKLTVVSGTPTSNGSTFTLDSSGGVNRLRLDAQDLAFSPGTYTLMLDLLDSADADDWKTIDRQVFVLEDT